MKMQKKQFRIGELAKRLNVERFVIRFWEKEFNLKGSRSEGGQRFYEEKDYNRFKEIKKLLYEDGFTINGARQKLKQTKHKSEVFGSHKTTMSVSTDASHATAEAMARRSDRDIDIEKLIALRQRLLKLQKML